MKGPETDHKWCFNPCFCGTRARTRLSVLWADLVCGFQSLFLWNSRPDVMWHQFYMLEGQSFNPCFCGTRARTRSRSTSCWRTPSFNPCFCGTRARTFSMAMRGQSASSLNPCFCGTRARTPCDDVHPGQIELFQSLFLWNSRPDFARTRCLHDPEIVSILVFVELAPGQRWCGGYSFKPLVSILVFVELAPGPFAIYLQLSILSVFQSLFLWNSRPDFHLYILP